MSGRFNLQVEWLEGAGGSREEQETMASLQINLNGRVLTRLEDSFSGSVRNAARLSGWRLGCWLATHWWRLSWEPQDVRANGWGISHRLPGAGGGFVWPDVTIVPDGERVLVIARRTRVSDRQPVGYLEEAFEDLTRQEWCRAVDAWMDLVLARLDARGLTSSGLHLLWQAVREERASPELTRARRWEALLHQDAETLDPSDTASIQDAAAWMGSAALEEVLAAERVPTLASTFDRMKVLSADSELTDVSIDGFARFRAAWDAAADKRSGMAPWERGAWLAKVVRKELGAGLDPLPDDWLRNVLGLSSQAQRPSGTAKARWTAAFRKDATPGHLRAVFTKRHVTSQRFEWARVLADAVTAPVGDRVLAATQAGTARQKLQRTFAQELLCPTEVIRQSMAEHDSADALERVAEEYGVSTWTVESAAVNNGLLARDALPAALR